MGVVVATQAQRAALTEARPVVDMRVRLVLLSTLLGTRVAHVPLLTAGGMPVQLTVELAMRGHRAVVMRAGAVPLIQGAGTQAQRPGVPLAATIT
jgi:hypothetical protein